MNIAIDTSVVLAENGLTVQLPSGRAAYFNAYWLRDNCPTSFDSQTRERTFDIFHLDAAPQPHSTALSAEGLDVVWNDGHRSTYPMDFLERYAKGELDAKVN